MKGSTKRWRMNTLAGFKLWNTAQEKDNHQVSLSTKFLRKSGTLCIPKRKLPSLSGLPGGLES